MSLALIERPTRRDPSRPLSAKEERSLAKRIKRGDQQAVERLVLANLGLVGRIARMFLGFGLSFEDLKQEGTQGLLLACADFDPESHDVRFSTYASNGIRNAIQKAIATHGSLIRLPDYMIRLRSKYRRTVGDLFAEEFENADTEGPNPGAPGRGTDQEIASRLGISLETLNRVRQSEFERTDFHRDSEDGDSSSFEETIADDSQPLFDLESIEELSCLQEGIELLAPHEAWVIRYRFGLDESPAGRPRTVQWIARAHRIAPETVTWIEEAAMSKLKTHLRKRLGVDE
jgi:RNA polymerase primary sigma factor